MTEPAGGCKLELLPSEEGCDPIEDRQHASRPSTIEAVVEQELDAFLARLQYRRPQADGKGYPHGRPVSTHQQPGHSDGEPAPCPASGWLRPQRQWHSGALGRYQRPTRRVEALLASAYRAGTHPRRVKKAVSPSSKERSAKTG